MGQVPKHGPGRHRLRMSLSSAGILGALLSVACGSPPPPPIAASVVSMTKDGVVVAIVTAPGARIIACDNTSLAGIADADGKLTLTIPLDKIARGGQRNTSTLTLVPGTEACSRGYCKPTDVALPMTIAELDTLPSDAGPWLRLVRLPGVLEDANAFGNRAMASLDGDRQLTAMRASEGFLIVGVTMAPGATLAPMDAAGPHQKDGTLRFAWPMPERLLDLPLGDDKASTTYAAAFSQVVRVTTRDGQHADHRIDVDLRGFHGALVAALSEVQSGRPVAGLPPLDAATANPPPRGVAVVDLSTPGNAMAFRDAKTARDVDVVAIAVKKAERPGRVCSFEVHHSDGSPRTGATVTMTYVDAEVRLYDARTGAVLDRADFPGGGSEACPLSHRMEERLLDGPKLADVLAWVAR